MDVITVKELLDNMNIQILNDLNQIMKSATDNSEYFIHNGTIFALSEENDTHPSNVMVTVTDPKNIDSFKNIYTKVNGQDLFQVLKAKKSVLSLKINSQTSVSIINSETSEIYELNTLKETSERSNSLEKLKRKCLNKLPDIVTEIGRAHV